MSDGTQTDSTSPTTSAETTKLSLKSLDARLQNIEDWIAQSEAPDFSAVEEKFEDLLQSVIESLVRTRSSGARTTAIKLRDKYLDPDVDVSEYGEKFITRDQLHSAGKEH